MVSSTSAIRGVVVEKVRTLGTRSDRAAARKSCGRMMERGLMDRKGEKEMSWTRDWERNQEKVLYREV